MAWPFGGDWDGLRVDNLPTIMAAIATAINERRDAAGASLIEWDLPDETTTEWPVAEDYHLVKMSDITYWETMKAEVEDLLVLNGGFAYTSSSFTTAIMTVANLDALAFPSGVPNYLYRMQDLNCWVLLKNRLDNLIYYKFQDNAVSGNDVTRIYSDPVSVPYPHPPLASYIEDAWANRTDNTSTYSDDVISCGVVDNGVPLALELTGFEDDEATVTYTIDDYLGTIVSSGFTIVYLNNSTVTSVVNVGTNLGNVAVSIPPTLISGGDPDDYNDYEYITHTIENKLQVGTTNTITIAFDDTDELFINTRPWITTVFASDAAPYKSYVNMDFSPVLTDQS